MKAPLSWLREFVDIDLDVTELAERLCLATPRTSVGSW
jgi:hypothetical protein